MLEGARQAGPLTGYPIRVDFLHAPTFGERTLLVGESAGLVNPLTGEGIEQAEHHPAGVEGLEGKGHRRSADNRYDAE